MKKLALMLAVVFFAVATFGQTTTTVKKDPKKVTTKTEQSKVVTAKTNATDKNLTLSKTTAYTTKSKLKKDGTPDKRFKENKTTVKTSGPMKKDGTPDMRYKDNKATTTTTTTATKK